MAGKSQSGFGQFWNLASRDVNDAGTHRKMLNSFLHGLAGTDVVELEADANYNSLLVSQPGDEYDLAYTGAVLDTITRSSDSKVITLTYTGDNLTNISDWT